MFPEEVEGILQLQ